MASSATPDIESAEAALAQLDPVEREVLKRRYALGEQPQSIQKALGLSDTAYREIISKAMAAFRDTLCR